MMSFASKVISFTPGFSPVERHLHLLETVSTVSMAKDGKPLKRFSAIASDPGTGLKPGVNEMTLRQSLYVEKRRRYR